MLFSLYYNKCLVLLLYPHKRHLLTILRIGNEKTLKDKTYRCKTTFSNTVSSLIEIHTFNVRWRNRCGTDKFQSNSARSFDHIAHKNVNKVNVVNVTLVLEKLSRQQHIIGIWNKIPQGISNINKVRDCHLIFIIHFVLDVKNRCVRLLSF